MSTRVCDHFKQVINFGVSKPLKLLNLSCIHLKYSYMIAILFKTSLGMNKLENKKIFRNILEIFFCRLKRVCFKKVKKKIKLNLLEPEL
jgi:uncharacterized membrane protein (DUF373 family)